MKKILFFDDEPFISKYLVKNLQENFGWSGDKEITLVSTVEELLRVINNDDLLYDLFVLDVMVPVASGNLKEQFTQEEWNKMDDGMSTGLVLAGIIREMEKYYEIPIIYLTARQIPHISNSDKKTAYLRKPVSPAEISNLMKDLLELK